VVARLYGAPLLLVEGRWAEAGAVVAAAAVLHPGDALAQARAVVAAPLARWRGDRGAAWAAVREVCPAGPATEPGGGGVGFMEHALLLAVAGALALDAGDRDAARAWLGAHDRLLAWSGATLGRAEGALGWAAYHRAAGDLDQARQHAERALDHAMEPRQPLALLAARRLLGELATGAGRHAAAATHLDEALALAEACAAPYERALTLLATAELRAATGNGEEARALLDEARNICEPLGATPALARAEALAATLAGT
jgi:tetratricopeptide repeat protein